MTPLRVCAAVLAVAAALPLRAAAEEAAAAPVPPAWQARLDRAPASPEAWGARREEIRRRILTAAGLQPDFARPPLQPVVFGRSERDGWSVEKVRFETWPGFHLTGNLYRPLGKAGPFPAVLSAHGHWKNGRFEDTADASVPGRAITLARLGFVVFTYDMVGYGDSKPLAHDFGDPAWGISLCGLQLWNSLRALDFLAAQPGVDAKRIGMTGASGGGTQTFLLTAADDRIACAAPVNMVAAEFQGGCLCENAPLLRIDLNNVEIAAATAPRPLLLIAATGDWTKDNPKVADPAIARVYDRLGVPERFRGVQFDYGHNYNRDSREAMYAWFVRWLQPGGPAVQGPTSASPDRIPEPAFAVPQREDLAVYGPDHPVPEGAADRAALEETIRGAIRAQLESLRPKDAASLGQFAGTLEPVLAQTLTARWPEAAARADAEAAGFGLPPESAPGGRNREWYRIDEGAVVEVDLPADTERRGADVIVFPRGSAAGTMATRVMIGAGHQGRRVAASAVKPFERREPKSNAAHGNTEKFATTYYRTALAWRVSDILSGLAYVGGRKDVSGVRLVGLGESGVPALLAAAVAPAGRVKAAIVDANGLDEADAKAWSGDLAHPGLLRVGGLRTAACLLAAKGVKLVLHNTQGKFDAAWARDAFKAAGREGDLVVDDKEWTAEQILKELSR